MFYSGEYFVGGSSLKRMYAKQNLIKERRTEKSRHMSFNLTPQRGGKGGRGP